MSGSALRHHDWPGDVTLASILAAATIFVWAVLKYGARILTDWQTGQWEWRSLPCN